ERIDLTLPTAFDLGFEGRAHVFANINELLNRSILPREIRNLIPEFCEQSRSGEQDARAQPAKRGLQRLEILVHVEVNASRDAESSGRSKVEVVNLRSADVHANEVVSRAQAAALEDLFRHRLLAEVFKRATQAKNTFGGRARRKVRDEMALADVFES